MPQVTTASIVAYINSIYEFRAYDVEGKYAFGDIVTYSPEEVSTSQEEVLEYFIFIADKDGISAELENKEAWAPISENFAKLFMWVSQSISSFFNKVRDLANTKYILKEGSIFSNAKLEDKSLGYKLEDNTEASYNGLSINKSETSSFIEGKYVSIKKVYIRTPEISVAPLLYITYIDTNGVSETKSFESSRYIRSMYEYSILNYIKSLPEDSQINIYYDCLTNVTAIYNSPFDFTGKNFKCRNCTSEEMIRGLLNALTIRPFSSNNPHSYVDVSSSGSINDKGIILSLDIERLLPSAIVKTSSWFSVFSDYLSRAIYKYTSSNSEGAMNMFSEGLMRSQTMGTIASGKDEVKDSILRLLSEISKGNNRNILQIKHIVR